MKKEVIVAMDFPSVKEAEEFLGKMEGQHPYLKIGMELFYAAGPVFVEALKDRGYKVFLDLKLHDIPNTVQRAMNVLAGLGVDLCNVHAAGTVKMMAAAREGLEQGTPPGQRRPELIAVTQLTSTDQWRMNHEILIPGTVEETVAAYAGLASQAGLDGVVCAPGEAPLIHRQYGDSFLTVTPGIRLAEPLATGAVQDQVRVQTPEMARTLGADYIVVGRPITGADRPLETYESIKRSFMGGCFNE